MAAEILASGVAAAVAVKSRHRTERAKLERLAEHVAGLTAAAVAASVVSQHGSPLRRLRQIRAGSGAAPPRPRFGCGDALCQHAAAAAMTALEAPDKSGDRAVRLDAVRHQIGGAQHRLMPAMQTTHHDCGGRCSFSVRGLRDATRPARTQLDHGRNIATGGRGIESAAAVRRLPGTPWPWAAPVSPARAVPTWSGYAGRSDRPTTRRGFGRVTNCQMRGNNAYEIEQTRQHLLNQTTSHQ